MRLKLHRNLHYKLRIIGVVALLIFGVNLTTYGQKSLQSQISDSLTVIANRFTAVGKVRVVEFTPNLSTKNLVITAAESLGYMPFRPDNVKRIYDAIQHIIRSRYSGFTVVCRVEDRNIEDLIPNFYRPENMDAKRQFNFPLLYKPLVTNTSRPNDITSGLRNRHIALWQSHGWYYDQKLARWEWQRARVLQVVEDLYTQSYVLPYLVPMLENAGANVLLPRERDTQLNEVIVDNDSKDSISGYREYNERKTWKVGEGVGFANKYKSYLQNENPFTFGTFKTIPAINDVEETSHAEWLPLIPESGRYAVYVSYKKLENSVSDAHYTVYHKGGKTDFKVNQNMCGGTWVYLGHFDFDKGRNNQGKVLLTNFSSEDGKMVTADAVKFGGGMGNIARKPYEAGFTAKRDTVGSFKPSSGLTNSSAIFEPEISRYPRYTEGARYWLQWAGLPQNVYSASGGKDDYTDDFQSRGLWVNYLIGGSAAAPNQYGMNVPVDLSLAVHSDAGMTPNDSIIGTLGISSIQNSDGNTHFMNGVSRWASRDLADLIQTQIVQDVRTLYAPEWTRRGIWNKSYSESRVPEVPAAILEILSHQNYADMRYGLDPRFRFTVSRSIYKGILKYLSSANRVEYVVQPLPVKQFSCRFQERNKVELHWVAVNDSLEPTALAEQYIVYTRIDDGGFNNGVLVNSNRLTLTVPTDKIVSFKVTAVNKGGESFPSEILSAYRAPKESGEVLIVNGFDRLSAPAGFVQDSTYAGFLNDSDAGVPYLSDISFVGKQYEFKRSKPWVTDDAPGFGASHANYETKVIAGNSFDYPYLHGKAIKAACFSFVSSSVEAVLRGDVDLNQYKIVDLILGKQKQTIIGNGKKAPEFKTFPVALQLLIRSYCLKGGNLLVSGSHIASDLCEVEHPLSSDRLFIENTLKYKSRTSKASVNGGVKVVSSPNRFFQNADISYYSQPNKISYFVESPDAIEPVGDDCFTICRYVENNLSAATAYSGKYKTCAFGFPFETIQSESDRAILMESILLFFTSN